MYNSIHDFLPGSVFIIGSHAWSLAINIGQYEDVRVYIKVPDRFYKIYFTEDHKTSSVTYLHCIFKGLHRSHKLAPYKHGMNIEDISFLSYFLSTPGLAHLQKHEPFRIHFK